MAYLQSFMSDLLSQCGDCSSISVVSDNARIPQQQQQQAASSGRSVSPRHLDYKGTARWYSGGDSVREAELLPPPSRKMSPGAVLTRKRSQVPEIPIRRFE